MKIGIVGNRTGWTYEEVKKQLDAVGVYKTDIIISGGAEGVDTFAQMYAKEIGAEIIILYPDPQKPHPQRYYDRNYEIANKCDCLIAFQKNPYKSGTQSTINRVKKMGKKAFVFGEKGLTEGIYIR
jgi:predicted Rossmann fold nucleotide-binding protein DprA/Smf involved in DNA uptake